jgi:hypothetical protein
MRGKVPDRDVVRVPVWASEFSCPQVKIRRTIQFDLPPLVKDHQRGGGDRLGYRRHVVQRVRRRGRASGVIDPSESSESAADVLDCGFQPRESGLFTQCLDLGHAAET